METVILELKNQRKIAYSTAKELFDSFVSLPPANRLDSQERTGLYVVVREMVTHDIMMFSVYQPSEIACFSAVEHIFRSEYYGKPTSQATNNSDDMKFAGSVSFFDEEAEYDLHVSVSGLKPEENVAIALILLSKILELSLDHILMNIKKYGNVKGYSVFVNEGVCINTVLPKELFDPNHYLYFLLKEYR